jgi:hypothetical protein
MTEQHIAQNLTYALLIIGGAFLFVLTIIKLYER